MLFANFTLRCDERESIVRMHPEYFRVVEEYMIEADCNGEFQEDTFSKKADIGVVEVASSA